MYAALVRLELPGINGTEERARLGRNLAALLSALPGFLTFVALDASERETTLVYIFEDRVNLDSAQQHIEQWTIGQFEHAKASIQVLGAGEIIAQKGL